MSRAPASRSYDAARLADRSEEHTSELQSRRELVWRLLREKKRSTSAAAHDQHRLDAALAARRTTSQQFVSSSVRRSDKFRDDFFCDRSHTAALSALSLHDALPI